jgi:hypothetical protein
VTYELQQPTFRQGGIERKTSPIFVPDEAIGSDCITLATSALPQGRAVAQLRRALGAAAAAFAAIASEQL